jgi:hypothetical protein
MPSLRALNQLPILQAVRFKQGLKVALPSKHPTFYSEHTFIQWYKKIVLDPKHVLSLMVEKADPLIEHPANQLSYSFFEQITKNYPLCFLSECMNDECLLHRMNTPVRKECEDELVHHLLQHYPHKQAPLVYLSFGCESLFIDCVILTKLIAAGYKDISIHMIDKRWKKYLEAVTKDGPLIFTNNENVHHKRKTWLRAHTYRILQLLAWLEECTKREVHLSLYDSPESYLAALKEQPELSTDILVGIDYAQETDHKALAEFNQLALYATKPTSLIFSVRTGTTITHTNDTFFREKVATRTLMVKKNEPSYAQGQETWKAFKEDTPIEDFFEIFTKEYKESTLKPPVPFIAKSSVKFALGIGASIVFSYVLYALWKSLPINQ